MFLLEAAHAAHASAPAAQAAASTPSEWVGTLTFVLVFLATFLSALWVVVAKEIIRAATALFVCLSGVAGVYFFLGAEFLGVVQIMVYVGGTTVLIMFGVMLTNRQPVLVSRRAVDRSFWGWIATGLVLGPLVVILLPGLKLPFTDIAFGRDPEATQNWAVWKGNGPARAEFAMLARSHEGHENVIKPADLDAANFERLDTNRDLKITEAEYIAGYVPARENLALQLYRRLDVKHDHGHDDHDHGKHTAGDGHESAGLDASEFGGVLYDKFNTDGQAGITFAEFNAAWKPLPPARDAFKAFDRNANGLLDDNEFGERARKAWAGKDKEGQEDHYIDAREFQNYIVLPRAGNTVALGDALLTNYLLPFEIASIVLLIALVGAAYIARRREDQPRLA